MIVQIVTGQVAPEKALHGIISNSQELAVGVTVSNIRTGQEVLSQKGGVFSIKARLGDELTFSAYNLEPRNHVITAADLQTDRLVVEMKFNSTELKEVIVKNHPDINAESLGIVSYGQKKYTPAERKLYEAKSSLIGGVLNGVSGRTAMLQRELEIERKETLLKKLEFLFDTAYYVERLKIPADEVKGFQMFCIEDNEFALSLDKKNKTFSMFLITGLAQKYLSLK